MAVANYGPMHPSIAVARMRVRDFADGFTKALGLLFHFIKVRNE